MSQILNKKQMSEEDIKFHYITPAITSSCHCNNITTVIHRCWLQNDQADCSRQNDRFHDRVQANHRSWHQTPWKTWQNALHGTLIVKGYFTQFTKKTQSARNLPKIGVVFPIWHIAFTQQLSDKCKRMPPLLLYRGNRNSPDIRVSGLFCLAERTYGVSHV